MIVAALLFLVGLAGSFFFSGTETGLYRVPRIRLLLDALAGSPIARGLLWLASQPAIFVGTALIGNNLANYAISLGMVLGVEAFPAQSGINWLRILVPLLATPLIFVFGELVPKSLFFRAPHRLLRWFAPLLLLMTAVLLPIVGLLGIAGRLLSAVTGSAPLVLRMTMARRELSELLREGQAAGLLAKQQRLLAENVWEVGSAPAVAFSMPIERLAVLPPNCQRRDAIAAAQRKGNSLVIARPKTGGAIEGYYRLGDLLANTQEQCGSPQPVLIVPQHIKQLDALRRMIERAVDVAVLVDQHGRASSIVTRQQLVEPLLTARGD
jgi:CBS domain containing-hemolysin-like protein